jgi:hypothetical protein
MVMPQQDEPGASGGVSQPASARRCRRCGWARRRRQRREGLGERCEREVRSEDVSPTVDWIVTGALRGMAVLSPYGRRRPQDSAFNKSPSGGGRGNTVSCSGVSSPPDAYPPRSSPADPLLYAAPCANPDRSASGPCAITAMRFAAIGLWMHRYSAQSFTVQRHIQRQRLVATRRPHRVRGPRRPRQHLLRRTPWQRRRRARRRP